VRWRLTVDEDKNIQDLMDETLDLLLALRGVKRTGEDEVFDGD
jgi:hypothetical protein